MEIGRGLSFEVIANNFVRVDLDYTMTPHVNPDYITYYILRRSTIYYDGAMFLGLAQRL